MVSIYNELQYTYGPLGSDVVDARCDKRYYKPPYSEQYYVHYEESACNCLELKWLTDDLGTLLFAT